MALAQIASVFLFIPSCHAESLLKIIRIQYGGGPGQANEDLIEISNLSDEGINIKGFRLVKRAKTSTKDTTIKSWDKDTIIPPESSYIWANSDNGFAESVGADTKTTQTISEGNGIAIRNGKENEGIIVDSINWKENTDSDEEHPIKPKESYLGKIKINEIYPSPHTKDGEKEFIEIINVGQENINIKDLIATDSSHKGNPLEKDLFLAAGEIYALEGTFYLNTPADTVRLINFDEKIIDSISYDQAKSGYSYSFDNSGWRWTKKITPGRKNEFDNILQGKIKKDKKIYAGLAADFEVVADEKVKKFIWNFGDEHKSYLRKTRHKYEKAGIYSASLKISGEGEDNVYSFEVIAEKFPRRDVRIIRLNPNPEGKDVQNEWIEIENNTEKKINLKNWSIASGTKNLYNHPIKKDFAVKPGKTKKLTKNDCAFTLANKKSVIELRYPNGETAQHVSYNKDKIEEEEIYEKINDDWQWTETISDIKEKSADKQPHPKESPVEIPAEMPLKESAINENGQYSFSSDWQEKTNRRKEMLSYGTNVKLAFDISTEPRVLGAFKINSENNFYFFTPPVKNKHWAICLAQEYLRKINYLCNKILN